MKILCLNLIYIMELIVASDTGMSFHISHKVNKAFVHFLVHFRTVLDPYGLMAILGFLVFLFYLIYNYLNASGNAVGTGRLLLPQHKSHQYHNNEMSSLIHFWDAINKLKVYSWMKFFSSFCTKSPKTSLCFEAQRLQSAVRLTKSFLFRIAVVKNSIVSGLDRYY